MMPMRDEDDVDVWQTAARKTWGDDPLRDEQPLRQHRVGEDRNPVHLDEHGRMTDERDADLTRAHSQPRLGRRCTRRSEVRPSEMREVAGDAEIRVDPRALGEEPTRLGGRGQRVRIRNRFFSSAT